MGALPYLILDIDAYRLIVAHQEAIARNDMRVKGGADCLIDSLGNTASKAFPVSLVNGALIDIIGSYTSYNMLVSISDVQIAMLTLVVMKLLGMVSIKLIQDLDHVGVGI